MINPFDTIKTIKPLAANLQVLYKAPFSDAFEIILPAQTELYSVLDNFISVT